MYFSHLQLTQFRNYDQLSAAFGPGINCITGNNGAGKTNILEAIHYLAITRGWQRNTEKYALKEGKPFFMIEGRLENEKPLRLQCTYMPPKGKKMLLDKKPLKRMSDHIGRIPVVTVLPNDTQLIYGSPGVRRKFMDGFISQYAPDYLRKLIAYDNAIAQRNALLSAFAERGTWDEEQLILWDSQLIRNGLPIREARRTFLERYQPAFAHYFRLIVSDNESPGITLSSQPDANTPEAWEALLARHRERDRHAQRSTAGIHKDDLQFTIDGQDVKNFGSQGQQKTFVIALKLAQYALLEEMRATPPVLLLDDIFDKLDLHRLNAIAKILDEEIAGQVFVTDTSPERTEQVFSQVGSRPVRYFRVADDALVRL